MTLTGRGVVAGTATGPALVSPVRFSFLGDLDVGTGTVVNADSPIRGRRVAGMILVLPASSGSAGGWRFLYQLFVHGTAPAGIVIDEGVDPSLLQGALLAGVPMVCDTDARAVDAVHTGEHLRLDATAGRLELVSRGRRR